MGSMLGLIATSALPQIRRHFFNVFYYLHWALFLMSSVAALYHSAKHVWWGVGIWLFDIAVRYIFMAGEPSLAPPRWPRLTGPAPPGWPRAPPESRHGPGTC
jgi:hypothetical protein